MDLGDTGLGCWSVFESGGVKESHIDFTGKEEVHSLCTDIALLPVRLSLGCDIHGKGDTV